MACDSASLESEWIMKFNKVSDPQPLLGMCSKSMVFGPMFWLNTGCLARSWPPMKGSESLGSLASALAAVFGASLRGFGAWGQVALRTK